MFNVQCSVFSVQCSVFNVPKPPASYEFNVKMTVQWGKILNLKS